MSIPFTCACGKTLKAKDEWAGKTVKCPNCGKPAKIPAEGGGDSPSRVAKPASRLGSSKQAPAGAKTKTAKKSAPAKKAASDDIDLMPEEPRKPPEPDPMSDGEMFTEEQASSLRATSKACPFCKKPIFEGDPLCINCGTDLKTGKKIEKKRERRPLGPFIKLGVIIIVVVGGGLYAWKWHKDSNKPQQNGGQAAAEDKTAPARQAIRDGNTDDFKGVAQGLKALSGDEIAALLSAECLADTPETAHDKAVMSLSLVAWYGFYNQATIDLLVQYLQSTQNDRVRQCCLEGLYAAGTAPQKRFIARPAVFDGLADILKDLPKSDPSTEALARVIEKADGANALETQLEGIVLAVVSGQPDKFSRLIGLSMGWPDRKQEIYGAALRVTARTFKDEESLNQWWMNEGQTQNPKQWVAARLDPANPIAELRAAVKVLAHLVADEVAKIDEKSTDEDVKQAAAKWKEWCDAHADKLQAP